MRGWIKIGLDHAVDEPTRIYLLAAGLALIVALLSPDLLIQQFITNANPGIPGAAFALLGFAITSLSVLVSLKGSPFFLMLQAERMDLWKRLIGAFIQQASVFAVFGSVSLLINASDVNNLTGWLFKYEVFVYLTLFFSTAFCTITAVHLLRLVANVPPVQEKQPARPIDTSMLDGFVNPTDLLPPREL